MSIKRKKSYVPIGRLKSILRDVSFKRPEYKEAKNRAKIDKALYKCELCSKLLYDGKSEKSLKKLNDTYKEVYMEVPELNHKIPVIDEELGWQGWDVYIERLFCGPNELEVLCKDCHSNVSSKEMNRRKKSGSLKRKKQ